ncbi:MAG: hypothetical protein R6W72_01960 [Desulfurivibrionaceae bacterium]
MRSINELWGDIGELPENETLHVITRLFAIYEDELRNNPDNEGALKFFRNLENVIDQVCACNSNRR